MEQGGDTKKNMLTLNRYLHEKKIAGVSSRDVHPATKTSGSWDAHLKKSKKYKDEEVSRQERYEPLDWRAKDDPSRRHVFGVNDEAREKITHAADMTHNSAISNSAILQWMSFKLLFFFFSSMPSLFTPEDRAATSTSNVFSELGNMFCLTPNSATEKSVLDVPLAS